ncbi:MAG TPA: serine/threonine-protein kinase [Candidatus Nanopelagicales bacterium]|nr:serine/threonine-protein kinase [Candidatus Nanopelagicales bacterium]
MSAEEKVAPKPSEPPRSNEAADPMVGKVLNGKFKINSMLATGGMGTIYRGEQLPLGRPVAVKVLIPNVTSRQLDPNFHKRFFLEASILAKLQHPNIVTVFDYGRMEDAEGERYFMAMEFLEGETLFRRVRRMGRLPPQDAMRIAKQIARGLREAHKQGVVHRDLKPSNIMLCSGEDGDEAVKILDFGLVKVLSDDSEELTQQGAFLGSPRFMSPEQISHGKVDLRTDMYSLGIILYQMLCGKVPFESDKSIQILMAHLQQPVPRMKERNPEVEVPEPLEALVMRCLSKDPDGRPSTMDAFVQQLGECARSIGVSGGFTQAVESLSGITSFRAGTLKALKEAETLPASAAEDPSGVSGAGALRSSSPGEKVGEKAVAPEPTGSKKGPLLVMVGLVAVAAVGAFIFLGKKDPPPAPTPAATQAPSAAPAPEKRAGSYTLMVESTPAGASVIEDGKAIGTTPLHLSIQNELVKDAPRRLTVQKEGFQPYSIVQGPSDESVRILATLVAAAKEDTKPEPPEPRTTGGGRPRPGPRPTPTSTAAAKPPGPEPPDISLGR